MRLNSLNNSLNPEKENHVKKLITNVNIAKGTMNVWTQGSESINSIDCSKPINERQNLAQTSDWFCWNRARNTYTSFDNYM